MTLMHAKEFNAIVERRLRLTGEVISAKNAAYAPGIDRLHNFNRAAAMLGCTPAQALLGFLAKHLVSIVDMVQASGHTQPAAEVVEEKIGDAINYLILLEAVFADHPGAKRDAPASNPEGGRPDLQPSIRSLIPGRALDPYRDAGIPEPQTKTRG